MIEPFREYSKTKYKQISSMLYDYNNFKSEGKWLYEHFELDKYKDFPYDFFTFVGENYKDYECFQNHVYLHKNEQLDESFYKLSNDFKDAAYACAEHMTEGERIERLDLLIFPLAYLYRHSIELLLKASILKEKINQGETNDKTLLEEITNHDLSALLDIIINFNQNNLESKNQHIEWLKAYLDDLSNFDKMSDSFRYPFKIFKEYNKLKIEYVFEEQRSICLIYLVEKFEYAYKIIENLYNNDLEDFTYDNSETLSTEFLDKGRYYYLQCVVGRKYNLSELSMYSRSYSSLAEHLFKQTIQNKNKIKNVQFFKPICYLYQNAIEVLFKAISTLVLDNQSALRLMYENKHKIEESWKKIYERLSRDWNDLEHYKEKIDDILKYLSPSAKVPVDTHSFRYPVNKNGQRTFKDETKFHIGYVFFFLKDSIDKISGLYYRYDEFIDYINEMKQEMGGYDGF
ncbi:hypothetical protein LAV73_20705 [Lysinibacillus xylanilyticus]|uniref:hypothetical protein n=1 Tax=Lysinibacillus xylanilyticus TaxID=582475 RepID=UPI002B23EFEC|nr:hypothetical protein [Lysinibacillus xylanilyticus]MEB2282375.1 hypothetical protein [Lysinibacillus xylanilyticus]